MWKSYICLLAICGVVPASAQDASSDRTTIAFSDPSRPGMVKVALLNGGITVRGYAGKEVIVEAHTRGARHRPAPPRADGLRRLDVPGTGLSMEEQDNVLNISVRPGETTDLALQVPWNTSLNLKSMNDGDILVESVQGEIDADNLNGSVILRNISGTAVAHSLNKGVTAVFDRVASGKSMSFSSFNGDIDVTLPADVKARVKLKTNNGEIFTDFEMTLESRDGGTSGRSRMRRMQSDKAFYGAINGGGPEMQFTTFNGKIYIRKKK